MNKLKASIRLSWNARIQPTANPRPSSSTCKSPRSRYIWFRVVISQLSAFQKRRPSPSPPRCCRRSRARSPPSRFRLQRFLLNGPSAQQSSRRTPPPPALPDQRLITKLPWHRRSSPPPLPAFTEILTKVDIIPQHRAQASLPINFSPMIKAAPGRPTTAG